MLQLLGIYATGIPASFINAKGSSSPTLLWPDAITISGFKDIIFSASGFLKSILVISELTPSTSTEYLSTATNLSASPKATKTSVLDGAVDIIVFTCLGTLN